MSGRCSGLRRGGIPCQAAPLPGMDRCHSHATAGELSVAERVREAEEVVRDLWATLGTDYGRVERIGRTGEESFLEDGAER
jgi:hypothetical protein